MRPSDRLARLSADDPQLRTVVAHLAALAAAVVVLALQGWDAPGPPNAVNAIAMAVGFSILHVASVRKRLAVSTLVLGAVGMALLNAGTGAPQSAFYLLALAGVWWAAHVSRPRGAVVYAAVYIAVYAVLVSPTAMRQGLLAEAVEEVVVLAVVALVSAWLVSAGRRAPELSDVQREPRLGPGELGIRESLARALGTTDIPAHAVLAAGRLGLTVAQAELLAYLVRGFSTRQIAQAIGRSEATVGSRLTRLYRALEVRGREEAARRGRDLGLVSPPDGTSTTR
jgi:DNA-binding CsgD family transcriptional regulator